MRKKNPQPAKEQVTYLSFSQKYYTGLHFYILSGYLILDL